MTAIDDEIAELEKEKKAYEVRGDSMAAPRPILTEAIQLKDSIIESIKHSIGSYGRGIKNIGLVVGEPLMTDDFIQDQRNTMAADQIKSDAQFKPYQEANPMSSAIVPGVAAMLPATKTIKGAIALGAGMEGLKYKPDVIDQGISAVGGGVGGGVGQAVGNKIIQGFSRNARSQNLWDEGLQDQTIGEQLGGAFKTAEDKLTSLPVVGYPIKTAKQRSREGFSRNRINSALKEMDHTIQPDIDDSLALPPGQGLSVQGSVAPSQPIVDPQASIRLPDNVKSGYEAQAWSDDVISKRYTETLDQMPVKVDQQFADEYAKSMELLSNLSEEAQQHVNATLQETLNLNFNNPTQTMLGPTFREVNTQLRNTAKSMSNDSQKVTIQKAGQLLKEIQKSFEKMALRQNPNQAKQYKAVERAFAKQRVNEDASIMRGAKDGVFNASQYGNAVKKNTDKRAFSHGKGYDQKLADDAEAVFNETINNSGTEDRRLFAEGLMTGAIVEPMSLIGMGTGFGMYSKPGQKALTGLLFNRPQHPIWDALKSTHALERLGTVTGAEQGEDAINKIKGLLN